MSLRSLVLCLLLMSAISKAFADDGQLASHGMQIFGWVERVELMDGKISVKAKLDTGAATSSLDATNIVRFRRGGERWVRFTITDPESKQKIELEKPLVRNVRIVRHKGEHQRRPVVEMSLCFGPFVRVVEFSLIDRSNFIYPVLLGRSAMEGYALVDSGQTFMNYPLCSSDSSR